MTTPTQETSWAWLLPSLVSALSALIGVLIGGWITTRNQKIDRQQRRLQEQLNFYGTLLGMRKEIRAKSEVRKRIQDLSRAAYDNELKMAEGDPVVKKRISSERWPEYEKGFQYDEKQLTEELVPLYGEILALWSKNMALAEPSTQAHYGVFVEYVEVWNRALKKTLVAEVLWEIRHADVVHPAETRLPNSV
jgi:hypothetical protein